MGSTGVGWPVGFKSVFCALVPAIQDTDNHQGGSLPKCLYMAQVFSIIRFSWTCVEGVGACWISSVIHSRRTLVVVSWQQHPLV